MLGKLIKHELNDRVKNLSVFYILSIVFAILTRIFFKIENSLIFSIVASICSGITISMMVNIIINNILRFWVRFRQTMYGDESYLTHTLPCKKSVIYASKILCALFTMLISVTVIVLSVFVAYYSKENIEIFKFMLDSVGTALNVPVPTMVFVLALVLFLQYSCLLQNGFTGIILGHKMQGGKIGFSFLFGFIAYSIVQMGSLLIIFIVALFDKNIMEMFTSNTITSTEGIRTVFIIVSIAYALFMAIGYIVNVKLLKKGVNVE